MCLSYDTVVLAQVLDCLSATLVCVYLSVWLPVCLSAC